MGSEAANLLPVFVTVDPEHDTPDLLKDYLANFGDNIVGLSGTSEQTLAITKSFGANFSRELVAPGYYSMDHSTSLYLVSPDGRLQKSFVPNLGPQGFANALRTAMGAK